MIPVCWYEGIAGLYAHEGVHGRSRYACCGLLNDMFDTYDCEHFSGFESLPKSSKGAVIIVHGGHLRDQVDKINQDASSLEWVIFIGIGDEDNDFPYHLLWHRNFKLWMQSPVPGKSRADRFPIVGYPCDMHEHFPPLKVCDSCQSVTCTECYPRPLDWFFAGQVTHERREECVAQLRNLPGGKLLETKQFYSGMEHAEYFRTLGQAKIIPCPSGPVNSDTFRMAEALEAGCIPVVDQRPGWKHNHPRGFFNMIFPQGFPFPLLENWSEFPGVLDNLLANYPDKQKEVADWWASYKADYYSWLKSDLRALGAS